MIVSDLIVKLVEIRRLYGSIEVELHTTPGTTTTTIVVTPIIYPQGEVVCSIRPESEEPSQ